MCTLTDCIAGKRSQYLGASGVGNQASSQPGISWTLYGSGNWNTIAICDTTGSVGERYAYSAYGAPVFMTGAP
jgi:hypothetical protein